MRREELLRTINALTQQWNCNKEKRLEVLQELEYILEVYLKKHLNDVEIWIRLALTVHTAPLADEDKAKASLKRALELEPNNITVLLILCELGDLINGIDEQTFVFIRL